MEPSSSKFNTKKLGMDHRGIVWCHNLLHTVRQIIFVLKETEFYNFSTKERLVQVRNLLQQVTSLNSAGNGKKSNNNNNNNAVTNVSPPVSSFHEAMLVHQDNFVVRIHFV